MGESSDAVLVVDDSDVIRTLIAVNLELEGFEVVTAVDGQDALERCATCGPDVITIDVRMPRLDGFDTVARLRADPRTSGIEGRDGDRLRPGGRPARAATSVGVDAYVTKPFDPAPWCAPSVTWSRRRPADPAAVAWRGDSRRPRHRAVRAAVAVGRRRGDLTVAVPAEVKVERPKVKEHGDYAT